MSDGFCIITIIFLVLLKTFDYFYEREEDKDIYKGKR